MRAIIGERLVSGYANTNAASKLFICATNQESSLDRAGFEALTWVQVVGVGSHGEVGSSTNILTYDTWDSGTALFTVTTATAAGAATTWDYVVEPVL